ncbi:hypothetical protein [Alkalicoccus daliensis]|uniref:hypothetical protein n=1 Tax=Alkalicoccus daliensis TaxID=745820 RepID=UPI001AEC87CF|nr:hypothetical protein [Alkalicoccus daliensis]
MERGWDKTPSIKKQLSPNFIGESCFYLWEDDSSTYNRLPRPKLQLTAGNSPAADLLLLLSRKRLYRFVYVLLIEKLVTETLSFFCLAKGRKSWEEPTAKRGSGGARPRQAGLQRSFLFSN